MAEPTVPPASNASGAHLVVATGPLKGQVIQPFVGEVMVVGSEAGCGFIVKDPGIAAQHLRLERTADGALFADDLSVGSTRLNGVTLKGRVMLRSGDEVMVGPLPLKVQNAGLPTPAQPMPPADLAPGTLIADRYRIVKKLAAGGMGAVYQAEHTELGRTFALKVMLPELTGAPDFVERFRREAVASSRIGHPNIVDITDFGRDAEGSFFFAMEFLEGQTLTEILEQQGPQTAERVKHLIAQACRGLSAAHALGVVHRDTKPENIMVLQRPGFPDHVKILDFGIAKVTGGIVQSNGTTGVGVVMGTPQYMSPEQASGLSIDHRSDIYSLGLIFYELLTGRRTFDAATPSLILTKHVSEAPPPMTKGPREPVPPAMQQLVLRMLSKLPTKRPQTMDDVLRDLGFDVPKVLVPKAVVPVQSGAETRVVKPASLKPPPKKRPVWIGPVVALILGAGLWWAWPKHRPVPRPVERPTPVEARVAPEVSDPPPVRVAPALVADPAPDVKPGPHPVKTEPPKKKPVKPVEAHPALKNVYED